VSWRSSATLNIRALARRAGYALLICALAGLAGLMPASADHENGVGLVIRHGDGTLIEVYVQFSGDSISGEELLNRSGLGFAEAPFGGLGAGVCTIDHEGCPSDNCYCKSYSNPAYYWHYYSLQPDGWFEEIRGPSTRELHDGDVDGWSWTAGDSELPAVTIDEIAAANGVDRNAAEPTATATEVPPTDTPTPPPPTATLAPTVAPPTPTLAPTATLPSVALTPTATLAPTRAAPTATSAFSTPTRPPASAIAAAVATRAPTPTPAPTTLGVVIPPNGTPTVLQPAPRHDSGSGTTSYVIFGAMAAVVVAAGGLAIWRRRGGVT
jgi:hypothetical protein